MNLSKFLAIVLTVVLAMSGLVAATETIGYGDAEAGPGEYAPKIYNCQRYVSLDGINPFDLRVGFYAFTGEMIYEGVIVRDPNGADDIGQVMMVVDEEHEVLCEDRTAEFEGGIFQCDDYSEEDNQQPDGDAYGHMLPGGFDADTDKFFVCVMTVEPDWYGESEVSIEAHDTTDYTISTNLVELWFFNPEVSVTVETSDGAPTIEFEEALPGETAYSTNKLRITNDAEGGVNVFLFLAASDLVDPEHSGAKCPDSNVLHVGCPEDEQRHTTDNDDQAWIEENLLDDTWSQLPTLEFLATSGTLQTGGQLWGIKGPGKEWKCVPEYRENDPCGLTTYGPSSPDSFPPTDGEIQWRCRNGVPIPDTFNFLTFGSTIEVAFRLHYPIPCIGEFTNGQIFVIAQAV